METSAKAVKKQLENLVEQIRLIRRLAGSPADFDRARELFIALKRHLQEEHQRMTTASSRAKLTDAEQRWYVPTVQQALANCINPARPEQREKWSELLSEAEDEFSWSLSNLKSSLDS